MRHAFVTLWAALGTGLLTTGLTAMVSVTRQLFLKGTQDRFLTLAIVAGDAIHYTEEVSAAAGKAGRPLTSQQKLSTAVGYLTDRITISRPCAADAVHTALGQSATLGASKG